MAGPKELEGQAQRRNRMRPDPDTLDKDVTRSGGAHSTPSLPRFDSNARMSGSARPAAAEHDKSAIPQTVDQSTGGVKPRTTGRRFRRTR